MKKLGVTFPLPGPCSLPENTYSIAGEYEKKMNGF